MKKKGKKYNDTNKENSYKEIYIKKNGLCILKSGKKYLEIRATDTKFPLI